MTPKKDPKQDDRREARHRGPTNPSSLQLANYDWFDTKLRHEASSQWVNAQGDLEFIQNPILRQVQKFGEHEQASSHLYFCEIFEQTQNFTSTIK